MAVQCRQCGGSFDSKSPQARFCGARCRKASSRGSAPVVNGSVTPIVTGLVGVTTEAAVVAELEGAGRLGSWRGAAAVALAKKIDAAGANQGYAGLIAQLEKTMAAAMVGVTPADEVDELRRRRDAKRNAS